MHAGHLVFHENRVGRRPLDAEVRPRVEGDGHVAFRQVEGDVLALDEVVLGELLADGREVLAGLDLVQREDGVLAICSLERLSAVKTIRSLRLVSRWRTAWAS